MYVATESCEVSSVFAMYDGNVTFKKLGILLLPRRGNVGVLDYVAV